MSGKLQGRDINGMHAAPWGKPDTSSISKMSFDEKKSKDTICNSIKQMLVDSIKTLYGTNKDLKYVKIVDMIMLRIRGALSQLEQSTQDQLSNINIDNLKTQLEDAFQKAIEKNNKEQEKKLQSIYDSAISAINDVISKNNANNEKTQNGDNVQKNAKLSEQHTKSNDEKSNEQSNNVNIKNNQIVSNNNVNTTQTIELLTSLQDQLTQNFEKLQNLITSNNVQKNAERAATTMTKPIDQKIVEKEKKNEGIVKSEMQKLDIKTNANPDLAGKSTDDKSGKNSKEQKKKKKNDLKDVMTGKQFNQLKKLLVDQFYHYIDISNVISNKVNRGFKNINAKLDKMIKDRAKHGFSWVKLMLFLSLFLIPMLWDKIVDFLKIINEKFKISDIIEKMLNSINWTKILNLLGGLIWKAVKGKFDKFVTNPIGMLVGAVKNTYNSLVNWVKDVWRWVTGDSTNGKKTKEEREKKEKKQFERSERSVEKSLGALDDKVAAQSDKVSKNAEEQNNKINESMQQANVSSDENLKKISEHTQDVINSTKDSQAELRNVTENAAHESAAQVDQMQENLEKAIDTSSKDASKTIQEDAKSVLKSLDENGYPSKLTPENMDEAEDAVEKADVTMPDVKTLESVKEYTLVKNPNAKGSKDKTLVASDRSINQQIRRLEKNQATNSQSEAIEFLKNAANVGQFTSNEDVSRQQQDAENEAILNGASPKKENSQEVPDNLKRGTASNEATSETFEEREARLYLNIDNAYNSILDTAAIIQKGLQDNVSIMNALSSTTVETFQEISDTLKSLKDSRKVSTLTVNNTTISTPSSGNNAYSANMK